jgi:hypothetical protein
MDDPGEKWNLTLDKYQRDNLLWLITLARDGHISGANTGDWVGEIANMLAKPNKPAELDSDDKPNLSIAEWVKFHK